MFFLSYLTFFVGCLVFCNALKTKALLTLAPSFDRSGEAQHMDVRMIYYDLEASLQEGDALLEHTLVHGPVLTMPYDAESVEIFDKLGSVPVHTEDSQDGVKRAWYLDRDVELGPGGLITQYRATPREIDDSTKCGPQIALERDEMGMSGAGEDFIIGLAHDVALDFVVEWDLSNTQPGTRAVSSLSREQHSGVKKVQSSDIGQCFFAVGSLLQSYPSKRTGGVGVYWVSEPPFDAVHLSKRLKYLYPHLAEFFEEEVEQFSVFIRQNPYRCASGMGLYRGFVFAWTPLAPPLGSTHLLQFLVHEAIHNWPRLEAPANASIEDIYKNGWFNEGIAELYSYLLPYGLRLYTDEEFIQQLNNMMSSYYTNPARYVLNTEISDLFWKDVYVTRVPYQRGMMYFLQLAWKLHVTPGARALEGLINEMVERRRTKRPHTIQVWLSLVQAELGPQALNDYEDMSKAKLIVLPPDYLEAAIMALTPGLQTQMTAGGRPRPGIERQDQEEFFLGFDPNSLSSTPRIVQGLDPESRAAAAGVRNGDWIRSNFSWMFDSEDWDHSFHMTVQRHEDGNERSVDLTWWPRTWNKVESYQFVWTN